MSARRQATRTGRRDRWRPLALALLLAVTAAGGRAASAVGEGITTVVRQSVAATVRQLIAATAELPPPSELGDSRLEPERRPADDGPGREWAGLLGHYEWHSGDGTVLLILHERRGRPFIDVGGALLLGGDWAGHAVLLDESVLPVRELEPLRDADGRVVGLRLGDVDWERTPVGTPAGETFRIEPVAPVEDLRSAALAADPPPTGDNLKEPDLVAVTDLEPGIRLDIRYAGTDNFMGAVFYRQEAALLQRPAAEAVARAHRALAAHGFGILIHDAYRPWFVTRMFWDATPERQRHFVADPSDGSRHNRGAAVDLTLFDLETGEAVAMPGGYDEFTIRSYPNYPGGTSAQRWRRDLLRRAMEAEGFDVYEFEWWHFDYRDWRDYPVLNLTFEEILGPPEAPSLGGR